MRDEYELKLALSPEQLEALPRAPFLRALVQGRKASTRLVNTYYDTPAGLLHKRAMALRVRRAGRSRTQTLKVKANGSSGLQHFQEYEATVPGDRPDLERIDDPGLKAMFAETGLAAQIGPVFTTDYARRKYVLRLFESEIELALDKGAIESGGQSMPICEAELELLSGRPSRLYELALALQDSVPFRLECRTKAGRGYALAMNAAATVVFGEKPALHAEMSAAQALGEIARACRDQIQCNEPVVLLGPGRHGDPEGLHQMRVGVRRLRAALRAFQPVVDAEALAYFKTTLGWLQKELGPARDWDVFVTETLPPIRAALPDAAGLEALISVAEAARRQAYERAHAAISDPRYVQLLLRLNLWLENGTLLAKPSPPTGGGPGHDPGAEPVGELAQAVLRRRDKKIRKIGHNHHELDAAELHELRIGAKNLRYAIEFFRTLYPKRDVKRSLKSLVAIQDVLGAVNDSVTCQNLLKELQVRSAIAPGYGKPLTERALGTVAGWQAAALAQRTRNFAAVWSAYKKSTPFWS